MTVNPESRAWQRSPAGTGERKADGAMAAALFGAAILSFVLGRAMGMWPDPASPALSVGMLALVTLPLAFRRTAPVPVLAVIATTFLVAGELQVPEVTISNIALFMAMYSVGAWDPNRVRANWARGALVVGMGLWLLTSFFRASTHFPRPPGCGATMP